MICKLPASMANPNTKVFHKVAVIYTETIMDRAIRMGTGANVMVAIDLRHIFQWDLSGYTLLWDH